MKTIVIHGSTRKNGNTEYLTHRAVPAENVSHVYLRDHNIQMITDERHSDQGFQAIEDDYHHIIDQMIEHDVVIFSTPIYWYSMSGLMKVFIDRFSQLVREKGYETFKEDFKKKTVYLIAVGGDNPSLKGLPLIQQFEYILQFFDSSLEGYILGQANKPGEIQSDRRALAQAHQLKEQL
ncbi:NAD(P)H-dependent oxidoreductase [Halobacillus sp. A1]|uniref:flavodoxin family protein n=1 Tax=Halobacillus sp. A1 TaxID=2880262 RepID=UPI0020A6A51B|nr:NAD(P)H-dependent oxidoreductase [Halobacillus sp. A1]MCP3030847.1 NAD(P)H-dependent oxidoreductase [Halobacillus sp. A1]